MSRMPKDLSGQRFDMLVVAGINPERHAGVVVYDCNCDCGGATRKTQKLLLNNQQQGLRNHCGCLGRGRGTTPTQTGVGSCKPHYREKDTWKRSFNHLFSHYKRQAAERGYMWGLSEDEFMTITSSPCYYCGVEPSARHAVSKNDPYVYNGIDRFNNTLGYLPDNVVPCCKMCNRMKWESTEQEMIDHMLKILEHKGIIRIT